MTFRSVTVTLYGRIRARASEFALRRAVGASRRDMAGLVLRDAGLLVAYGSAGGCIATAPVNRGLPSLMAGLEPLSPWLVAGLAALLAACGLGSALAAGWRVLRAPPARMPGEG